ncbi:hypothetical protein HBH56_015960 [Parastagonospora nodorum]|nr:hypothetical protein HBH56_015960 [Parastagonospora nodorum]KAH3953810.1 hypothetical protein HBH53_030880 [Parastagonospora nodorum]KAH4177344.1 hypothetical protein HBH43_050920 [Parastagonospora nodorum]KAH4390519.1 hypothetical protein HBH94_016850 [Parastagonospora nodorum]KAH4884533.1 hypothetical protein HBH59_026420 [Parastagonospora nodorum]
MAELPPLPKYFLILVSLPGPPLITIGKLDERVGQLASEVYPTAPREEPPGEALVLITGPVSDKDERICIAQIKR